MLTNSQLQTASTARGSTQYAELAYVHEGSFYLILPVFSDSRRYSLCYRFSLQTSQSEQSLLTS